MVATEETATVNRKQTWPTKASARHQAFLDTRSSPQEAGELTPLEGQRKTEQLGLVAWPVMSASWRLRQEDWLQARLETLGRETLCQNKTKGSAGLDTGECRKRIRSSRPTFTRQGQG